MTTAQPDEKRSVWRLLLRAAAIVILALLLSITFAGATDTLKVVAPNIDDIVKSLIKNLGLQGQNGVDGAPGANGASGSPGIPGSNGSPGPSGPMGPTGKPGEKGDKGDTGASGSPGATGPMGPTGQPGEKGDKGDTGATGKPGDKGDTGNQGPKGDTGATGAVGPMGPAGPQGEKGDTGATGATGAPGDKGDTGATGATGAVGPMGPAGPQGAKGDKGDTGAQGEPGTSIYGYHGSFLDTTTQTQSSAFTARAMQLNTTVASDTNGFTIVTNGNGRPTKIKALHSGVYNIQFSAQLGRVGNKNNDMFAEIWLAADGQTLEDTNTKIYITGNQPPDAKSVASWNFVVSIPAGHYVELMWSVSDTDFVMPRLTKTGETPNLTGPDVPSLIVTVSQVG